MSKKIFASSIFAFVFLLVFGPFFAGNAFAGPGDTTTVRVHDAVHWNWYGNRDQWGVFPSDTGSYRKIIMRYTLGCPAIGCSDWDYTTNIQLRQHTGTYDSTFNLAPNFTVEASIWDSVCYSNSMTYVYFWDSLTGLTDSVASTQWLIREFNDGNDPYLQTDSQYVWPAEYYNYLYDGLGVIKDSVWVNSDTCLYISYDTAWNAPFEVIIPLEMGRLITPYSGNRGSIWSYTWYYDVTDFAPLLHDSVEIRAWYGGWQDGFTITLDFDFIEGIPPRECKDIEQLWYGEFQYGNVNNDIENRLVPRDVLVDPATAGNKMTITTTGHSFGGNQNCAEFCHKYHDVVVEDTTFIQDLWRYDCPDNSLYPQTGTWLYERAGWCPGSYATIYEYECTPWAVPGDTLTVDYNMAPYVYTGGAGFHPNYFVSGLMFHYGAPNHALDAEILNVTRPNDDPLYVRDNPVCNKPLIEVRNVGSSPITSLEIKYGVVGGDTSTYLWTGSLAWLEKTEIELPMPVWGTLQASGNWFEARISAVNGVADDYALNDSYYTTFNAPPVYPDVVFLYWRTNGFQQETKWELLDDNDNALYSSSIFLSPNTIYRDTFWLNPGCYKFRLWDTDGDGLTFFANNDGSGFMHFKNAANNQNLHTFNSDFGHEIHHYFTVDNLNGLNNQTFENIVEVYPNPATEQVKIDLNLGKFQNVEVELFSLQGTKIKSYNAGGIKTGSLDINLEGVSSGLYFVKVKLEDEAITKKIVIRR